MAVPKSERNITVAGVISRLGGLPQAARQGAELIAAMGKNSKVAPREATSTEVTPINPTRQSRLARTISRRMEVARTVGQFIKPKVEITRPTGDIPPFIPATRAFRTFSNARISQIEASYEADVKDRQFKNDLAGIGLPGFQPNPPIQTEQDKMGSHYVAPNIGPITKGR